MSEPATTAPTPSPGSVSPSPVSPDAPDLTARRCPWCSEVLAPVAVVRCPACHANLVPDRDRGVPGLTEVEASAATRARRSESPRRSRLLSWISGEVDDASVLGPPDAPDAVAPPSRDVRREIWRLTLEAEGIPVSEDGEIMLPSARPATPSTAGAPDGSADAIPDTGTLKAS